MFINALLPIVFISALMGLMFHFGILQAIIGFIGKTLAKFLDVDTLVAVNNVTNMFFGPDNPRKGETLFAWVTGTAGWMFRAIVQYILGFHPSYNSFTLNPCLPSDWDNVTMTRAFRGDTYKITIKNPNGKQSGVTKITVDGVEIDGNEVDLFGDGKTHEIIVEM